VEPTESQLKDLSGLLRCVTSKNSKVANYQTPTGRRKPLGYDEIRTVSEMQGIEDVEEARPDTLSHSRLATPPRPTLADRAQAAIAA